MSSFEIQYVDPFGTHAEVVDAWDQEQAVQEFRLTHKGQKCHMTDVVYVGEAEEVEA
ncbi:MAG: hypothetical protein NTW96_24675 [Planctomycetia bacterium]|nr:hypothetical protein [Planctomycetia bacterium]